jgi:hypothetical protein
MQSLHIFLVGIDVARQFENNVENRDIFNNFIVIE